MVLRELGARFGVAAATIAETLFPLRRPSPYQLCCPRRVCPGARGSRPALRRYCFVYTRTPRPQGPLGGSMNVRVVAVAVYER
jgi:hypothetical protein